MSDAKPTNAGSVGASQAPARQDAAEAGIDRREVLRHLAKLPCSALLLSTFGPSSAFAGDDYDAAEHYYGMGIQIDHCIGCGRCVEACKTENDVPREPVYFRTWVERYTIDAEGEATVDSPDGGIAGFPALEEGREALRSFFVPKLCNQCDNPPCVQVCPVGATFKSEDGVVLIDDDYCIGCSYCVQACPYGARYKDPETRVADKCDFCYHRLRRGKVPACVEACPTGARVFGEVEAQASPLRRLKRTKTINVLKAHLNTEPKVFYTDLDGEVR